MSNLYVDVHVLNTLGPSNVNRDDAGAPKTVVFGGVTRSRQSSQSQKAAVRKAFFEKFDTHFTSLRSRSIPLLIASELRKLNPSLSVQESNELVGWAMCALASDPKVRDKRYAAYRNELESRGENYVPTLDATFPLSVDEARAVAQVIVDALATGLDTADKVRVTKGTDTKALVEALRDAGVTVDVALFGKMFASNPKLNVDAAVQVAHAVGVSAYAGDLDFYTATDDLLVQSNETVEELRATGGVREAGADMMDTKGITAGTVYRYTNINVPALVRTLGSGEDAVDAVKRYIETFVTTLPGGAQNGHAARAPYSTVVISVRSDQPMSLVAAYEVPVNNAAEAVKVLGVYAASVAEMYATPPGDPVYVLSVHGRDGLVKKFGADTNVKSLPDALDALGDHLLGAL